MRNLEVFLAEVDQVCARLQPVKAASTYQWNIVLGDDGVALQQDVVRNIPWRA
jgi:hypothetical protein